MKRFSASLHGRSDKTACVFANKHCSGSMFPGPVSVSDRCHMWWTLNICNSFNSVSNLHRRDGSNSLEGLTIVCIWMCALWKITFRMRFHGSVSRGYSFTEGNNLLLISHDNTRLGGPFTLRMYVWVTDWVCDSFVCVNEFGFMAAGDETVFEEE